MFHPDRLVKFRKKKKLTQEELAIKVNTTKGTISNYENGHSTPPHETLVLIANELGVTTDYLLGRTSEPNSGGESSKLSVNERKVVEEFSKLSETDQEYVLGLLRRIKKET